MIEVTNDSSVVNTTEGLNKEVGTNNTIVKETPVLNVASLCSGLGSDKVALTNIGANYKDCYSIELDPQARKVYALNHGKPENSYKDITKVNPNKLAKVDLMMISVPCQSYSLQNCNRGKTCNSKSNLWKYAIDILSHSKSKYFVFENVEGLVSIEGGQVFRDILKSFKKDYNIHYKILNSKNYGNSCQNRKRVFVVGIKKSEKNDFSFPEPQAINSCINDFVDKNADISALTYDASKRVPFITKKETDIKKKFRLPLKYEADARIVDSKGILPCIVASSAYTKIWFEEENIFRYLSNKELSSIMGLKDFDFGDTKKMKTKQLIGNSIDINVLSLIFKNLIPSKYFSKNEVASTLKEVL
jgi:DNA (cytosine-5)-methyltransferase 1